MCKISIFDICVSYTLNKITFLDHKFVIVMIISHKYIYSPAPGIGLLGYCAYDSKENFHDNLDSCIFGITRIMHDT